MLKTILVSLLMLTNFAIAETIELYDGIKTDSSHPEFEYAKGVKAYKNNDFPKAFSIWSTLAEKGNKNAQFALGGLFVAGQGVEKNNEKAAQLFYKAAVQAHAGAQARYGSYVENQANYSEAYAWYVISAINGSKDAQRFIPQIRNKMTDANLVEGKKMARQFISKYSKQTSHSIAEIKDDGSLNITRHKGPVPTNK